MTNHSCPVADSNIMNAKFADGVVILSLFHCAANIYFITIVKTKNMSITSLLNVFR